GRTTLSRRSSTPRGTPSTLESRSRAEGERVAGADRHDLVDPILLQQPANHVHRVPGLERRAVHLVIPSSGRAWVDGRGARSGMVTEPQPRREGAEDALPMLEGQVRHTLGLEELCPADDRRVIGPDP